jgi:hypothetical protein
MNETTTVAWAVEALQIAAARGEVSIEQCRETLRDFGGIPHNGINGTEMFLFVGQVWDVEVMTSLAVPDKCILWKCMSPD